MAMKNAKQDIRLSSVVSLEKDVANYRDTIKTMKASHADELLLLREAHEAEVKTLTTTIGQLQRELKRHQPILKGSSPSREHTLLGLHDAEASEAAERMAAEAAAAIAAIRTGGHKVGVSYKGDAYHYEGRSYRMERRRREAATLLQRNWRGRNTRHIFHLVGEYSAMMAAVKKATAAKLEAARLQKVQARAGAMHREERKQPEQAPVTPLLVSRASDAAATAAAAAAVATAAAEGAG